MNDDRASARGGSALLRVARRHPYWALFLFAFVFRLVYVAESTANPLFGVPLVDARVYDEWSSEMASGHWLWTSTENYLPIYPYFLAVQKALFGQTPFVNKLLQAILGAWSCALLGLAAERAWSRRVGLTAGLFVATYWTLVVYESEKYAESFSIFFQSLTLFLLVAPRLGAARSFGAGLAHAISGGARANLLLVGPFLGGWIAWRRWPRWRLATLSVALFVIGVGAVLLPIAWRNHQLSGKWMLREQATFSLWSGIDPRFEGLPIPPGVVFDNYMREPIRAGLRDPADIERYWKERAERVARERPGAVAWNMARRALMLLNAREHPKEIDVHAYRGYSVLLSLPWWPGFWLFAPLGVLGVFVAGYRSRRDGLDHDRILFLLVLGVAFVSLVPFKFSDRYRLAIAPPLAVFASVGLWRLVEWGRSRRFRRLSIALVALAALCLLSWPDWFDLRGRHIARHWFLVGTHWQELGRLDDAARAYERSMKKYPWDADSPCRIGWIRVWRDRPAAAAPMFREALRREPNFPEALAGLGRVALERGSLDEAERLTSASLSLYPNYQIALTQMARIAAERGDLDSEIAWYTRALAEGAPASVAVELALRLEERGSLDEAIALYDNVAGEWRAGDFQRARALLLKGVCLGRRVGDWSRAREAWRRLVREFPDERYFALQAAYLLDGIARDGFLEEMDRFDSSGAANFAIYDVGLRAWMDGAPDRAAEVFKRLLGAEADAAEPPRELPKKWAWEDLPRLGGRR